MEIKSQKFLIFLLIIILSLFALLGMNSRSALGDEFGTIWLASQNSVSFIIEKVQQTDVNPPTQYLLFHYWGKIFGYSDYAMRLLPLLFTLLSIILLWDLIDLIIKNISLGEKILIFLLSASAPVIWTTANVARYYSLGMFFGLLSAYFYLKWYYRQSNVALLLITILITSFLFYVQYLMAAVLALGQGLHYLANIKSKSIKERWLWILSQSIIILLFSPIFLYYIAPILIGKVNNLNNSAFEGISGFKAIPLVFLGNIFTTFTGAIPFPWDVWVTLPLIIILLYTLIFAIKERWASFTKIHLYLCFLPFLLLSIIIALILPVTGYFYGIYRAVSLAVLVVLIFSSLILKISNIRIRYSFIIIMILMNIYLIIIYNLNSYSYQQTPPIKEIAQLIINNESPEEHALIFHPFVHGWGDPIIRYLPDKFSSYFLTDLDNGTTIDSSERIVTSLLTRKIFLINSNRFDTKASILNNWLQYHGYVLSYQKEFQKQYSYDLWFKNFIQKIKFLDFKQETSHEYILSLKMYERKPN